MAELVPALAAELQREIAAYEWHRGARARGPMEVPADLAQEISTRSAVLGLDPQQILRDAINLGLSSTRLSSVPTSRKIEDHREAHDRVRAKHEPVSKRSRKRKAS
ncbi:MAG: hypothetical protein M1453_07960 [Acidobacteria bacterium]|nr:hypothetical protein [Acidobacteriota bacterium]